MGIADKPVGIGSQESGVLPELHVGVLVEQFQESEADVLILGQIPVALVCQTDFGRVVQEVRYALPLQGHGATRIAYPFAMHQLQGRLAGWACENVNVHRLASGPWSHDLIRNLLPGAAEGIRCPGRPHDSQIAAVRLGAGVGDGIGSRRRRSSARR